MIDQSRLIELKRVAENGLMPGYWATFNPALILELLAEIESVQADLQAFHKSERAWTNGTAVLVPCAELKAMQSDLASLRAENERLIDNISATRLARDENWKRWGEKCDRLEAENAKLRAQLEILATREKNPRCNCQAIARAAIAPEGEVPDDRPADYSRVKGI